MLYVLLFQWFLIFLSNTRILYCCFSDDRHPYFKPGKPKEQDEEEDLNDANYDEVGLSVKFTDILLPNSELTNLFQYDW